MLKMIFPPMPYTILPHFNDRFTVIVRNSTIPESLNMSLVIEKREKKLKMICHLIRMNNERDANKHLKLDLRGE